MNTPGRREGKAKAGPRNDSQELSFQDLIGELGDVPPLSSPDMVEGGPSAPEKRPDWSDSEEPIAPGVAEGEWYGTVSGDMPARPVRRKREENPLNARVLTESGTRKTPLWLKTLYMAAAAWLLLLPIWTGVLTSVIQPWYSYSVMALGGGAVFWAAYGMYHEATPALRANCLGGLMLGLGAAVMAFLLRTRGIIL